MNLDSRQVRIARWLLNQDGPQSTSALAADLGLSQRVIRYRLDGVERYLNSHHLDLVKQRGVGLVIEGTSDARRSARAGLATVTTEAPRVFAPDERLHLLMAVLLAASPDPVTVETLHQRLDVSETSTRRDTRRAEPWFEQHNLLLVRRAGAGVSVVGTEPAVRRAMLKLMLEAVPAEAFRQVIDHGYDASELINVRVSAGLREFLRTLSLRQCAAIARASGLDQPQIELELPLHLAISAFRIKAGRSAVLDPGQLRSLTDHPVSATAEGISLALADVINMEPDEHEVASLTEFLLGLVSLDQAAEHAPTVSEQLVDEVLDLAAARLHPAIADDAELRRGLGQHLERLQVRIRYSLPVHNPLLADVVGRWPHVHEAARHIAQHVSKALGGPIPEDEIGFLTMYLSGAMERTHLWPRRRAVVVCPSGMATVWILVSRIQAEFPELELVDVVSAHGLDPKSVDADLVISTVELAEDDLPVAVVNALLTPDDVRSIARLMSR